MSVVIRQLHMASDLNTVVSNAHCHCSLLIVKLHTVTLHTVPLRRSVRKTTLLVSVGYVLFGRAAISLLPANKLAKSTVPLVDIFSAYFTQGQMIRQFWG